MTHPTILLAGLVLLAGCQDHAPASTTDPPMPVASGHATQPFFLFQNETDHVTFESPVTVRVTLEVALDYAVGPSLRATGDCQSAAWSGSGATIVFGQDPVLDCGRLGPGVVTVGLSADGAARGTMTVRWHS